MIHLDPDWLREHVPDDIPDSVLQETGVLKGYYIDGLAVYNHPTQRDSQTLKYQAKNDDDLRIWEFKVCCQRIGFYMALRTRGTDSEKWRYPSAMRYGGKLRYRENRDYAYDAIYDSRKVPFEVELRLLKPVLESADWNAVVTQRELQLNSSVNIDHWRYDNAAEKFVEK